MRLYATHWREGGVGFLLAFYRTRDICKRTRQHEHRLCCGESHECTFYKVEDGQACGEREGAAEGGWGTPKNGYHFVCFWHPKSNGRA